jgi:SSS family solute:Na+ symporter
MSVTFLDWTILIVIFLLFLGLAIYLNSYVKSVADYLVSGRKVRMWLGLGAGVAGEIGLVTVVSMCEQGYMRGFGFILIALLAKLILLPIFGIFGFGIERFRATKAISVPQYIEMRYSKRLRILTGIFNSISGVLQMAVFPIVGAGFVKVLINAPDAVMLGGTAIPTTWIIMAILLTCVMVFTYFGGYITLVVSNFFQMIIIVGALYWLFFVLIDDIGLNTFWTNIAQTKGLKGFYSFAPGSEYGVTFFLWMLIMSILLQFSYGPYLQKYASMDKPKTARLSYMIGMIFSNGRSYIILGLGVAALAVLGTSVPEGIAPGVWKSMATPFYLSKVVPAGLMGFLLAGLLFADVSTTDQYILTWSTSIVNDCICPFKKKPFTPENHIKAVKITIVALCIFFFITGIFYEPTMPIMEFLWLCANIIGGTGIAVLAGMYWKRASTSGAYAAILISLILPISDIIARRIVLAVNGTYPWAPKTTGFATYAIAAVMLVVFSLLSKEKSKYWDLGKAVKEMNEAK